MKKYLKYLPVAFITCFIVGILIVRAEIPVTGWIDGDFKLNDTSTSTPSIFYTTQVSATGTDTNVPLLLTGKGAIGVKSLSAENIIGLEVSLADDVLATAGDTEINSPYIAWTGRMWDGAQSNNRKWRCNVGIIDAGTDVNALICSDNDGVPRMSVYNDGSVVASEFKSNSYSSASVDDNVTFTVSGGSPWFNFAGGNVGIGAEGASEKLEVVGNIKATGGNLIANGYVRGKQQMINTNDDTRNVTDEQCNAVYTNNAGWATYTMPADVIEGCVSTFEVSSANEVIINAGDGNTIYTATTSTVATSVGGSVTSTVRGSSITIKGITTDTYHAILNAGTWTLN